MQKEEELLRKRLIELSKIAYHRNFITYTDFLNLNELNILHSMPKDTLYTPYRTFGGYASSERQIAAFLPDALCLRSEIEDLAYPMGIIISCRAVKVLRAAISQRLFGSTSESWN